jgi:hypothetical protein
VADVRRGPAGWRVVYGEAGRATWLDYIERNRIDIRAKGLREGLAAGRGSEMSTLWVGAVGWNLMTGPFR